MQDERLEDRLIVALDTKSLADTKALVVSLGDCVTFYKVGMEIFYSVGGSVVTWLKQQGKSVFLDLKLHDIPNTVGQGLLSLLKLEPDIINVHASGGYTMMNTASNALKEAAKELKIKCPKLIAVTVLTSISEEDWQDTGHKNSIEDDVVNLALLAKKAGLDGVVASPKEAISIQKACGKEFLIITPGVRLSSSNKNDQVRIATPKIAIENGASHLVVGRPITTADNPHEVVKEIIQEMRSSNK